MAKKLKFHSKSLPFKVISLLTRFQVDLSGANPNGVEFDNLYIDMNGVIHPCSHPEDRPAPRNEEEIFECIFDALDRMMNIVRPRKLLYLAIDG